MVIPSVVDVFIVAGQSNAAGTATGFPKDSRLMSPEGIIYTVTPNATNYPPPVQNDFCRMCALDTLMGALNNRGHGIELNAAFQYNAYFGKPCIFIKSTEGATDLHTNWASGSVLRNKLIADTNAMTTKLTNMGKTWTIAGFYWNQWEGDVNNASYKTELESLVVNLRANITGFSTSTPFVCVQPSVKVTFGGDITNIRAAINAAVITNKTVLNQDDLFYQEPDASLVHCNSWSQNLLAQRFLTAIYPSMTFVSIV